jgi:hypothetical protein
MSIELHYDGTVTCEFGEVAATASLGHASRPALSTSPRLAVTTDGSGDMAQVGWPDFTPASFPLNDLNALTSMF